MAGTLFLPILAEPEPERKAPTLWSPWTLAGMVSAVVACSTLYVLLPPPWAAGAALGLLAGLPLWRYARRK